MFFDLDSKDIQQHISEAEFGIERESLRVNSDGTLAQTKHPFTAHPNIDRDFCENQVELIGDVFTNPEALNSQLNRLLDEVDRELRKNNELLWPFSNPPKISGEDEIPVALFTGTQKGKSEYRHYLASKYGKKKMLFSGIHLNLSFSEPLLGAAFAESGEEDFAQFKNRLYLRLAKRLTQYAWLAVYLTASSPVTDDSLGIHSNVYSSVRCSKFGYWNAFTPILDYSSIRVYVGSIARYIVDGSLKAASELYYPVRVKPRGLNSLESLLEKGINHLELRVIDVNPLSRSGIFTEDIRFIHLLILYLASLPDFDFDSEAQEKAVNDVKAAAVFGNEKYKTRAEKALSEISAYASENLPEYQPVVEYQQSKLRDGKSYAEIVSREFGGNYMKEGIALARSYQRGESSV